MDGSFLFSTNTINSCKLHIPDTHRGGPSPGLCVVCIHQPNGQDVRSPTYKLLLCFVFCLITALCGLFFCVPSPRHCPALELPALRTRYEMEWVCNRYSVSG